MTPESNLQFNIRASLIRRLAAEVLPDATAALNEVIKNAYDADATDVEIEINTHQVVSQPGLHFKTTLQGFITVRDNGKGMNWVDVQKNWMNFSFSAKKELKAKETTQGKRTPVGGQGLGRLGTARLGDCVELFSCSGAENSHVAFDWNDFRDDRNLTEVPFFAARIPGPKQQGSSIWMFPLKDPDRWKGDMGTQWIEALQSKISLFTDQKSFRIKLVLDGVHYSLSDPPGNKDDRKVFWENIWQKTTPELIREVMLFWEENKMIRPGFSTEERARQVVLIIRSVRDHKIVGLSTADVVQFKQLNSNNFYLYRSIILPEYRHPGLPDKIIIETRDFLESFNRQVTVNCCIGLLAFVENPRFQQHRREAIWPASRMAYVGIDKQGRHIRVYYFKGATI